MRLHRKLHAYILYIDLRYLLKNNNKKKARQIKRKKKNLGYFYKNIKVTFDNKQDFWYTRGNMIFSFPRTPRARERSGNEIQVVQFKHTHTHTNICSR